jgi:BASS family bile acid:Na+ symporter
LLPVLGWLLVRCLNLQPVFAQGVLLVVACPSVGLANVYTYLARANVALYVIPTAMSCLAAVLTAPLALAALQAPMGESTVICQPFVVLAGQLFLLLVLPVLAGLTASCRAHKESPMTPTSTEVKRKSGVGTAPRYAP